MSFLALAAGALIQLASPEPPGPSTTAPTPPEPAPLVEEMAGVGTGTATVDGDLAWRGDIMFALVDKPEALAG